METTDSINPIEAISAAVEAQAHTTDIDMLAVKSVNDTLIDASREPDPEPLYDKLWYQGEVSCLFADSNIGKSLFAVQIAEGIAQRFRVLYLDCELSAKQFQDRYTNKKTGQLHRFPDNFFRATIVPARMDLKDWEDRILANIEKAALQMKTPVIIVDNIGYLCNNAEKGQDAGTFMMKLLKLKQQYAWSILIIAHTPKRHAWAPITQNDLAGSKKLFNYFDSVFAIGLSSKDENFRFVKQLKVRYGGFSYGAGSVMVFELSKDDDMVRFNFLYTEPEKNHLSEPDDNDIIQRDMRVVELHKQGLNYRDIAAQVGISKSMVGKIIAKAEQSTTASTVDSVDKVDTIPDDIVARSIRPTLDSDFITFLRTLFDPITVSSLIQEYRIGVTREKAVIFYQIDIQGRCRTGKVMKYDPETGHRIKDENTKGRITWVHSLMKYAGQLPQEWTLTQCLFGEHLLPLFPEKPVALVESEKTAIICAGLIPKFIWLATGGKSQINSRLDVLKGRSITAFPDIDGYSTWVEKLAQLEGFSYTVCDLLVKYGKPEDHDAHIDIADWLIRWHRTPNPRADATFAAVAQYFSPEVHDEIRALIHDLDLEFVGVEKIEDDAE